MASLVGQSLGRYQVVEFLGEGGMAEVYKAYDPDLDRYVAVKLILISRSQGEVSLKRFRREARTLAKLTHPNIVHIIEFGEQDGMPFLVMDYLPGGTLKERLGSPLPLAEAARLAARIARALDAAHQEGFIHRDVKPANVLFTRSGDPILTDFGVAKMVDYGDLSSLTGHGRGLGTPNYMAPEQWRGEVTFSSDIYALGVILFEMLTGRKPFPGDDPATQMYQHLTQPAPDPRHYVPTLPQPVADVLAKALAKQPKDRYASAAEFALALEELALLASQEQIRQEKDTAPVRGSTFAKPPPGGAAKEHTQPTPQALRWRRLRLLWGLGIAAAALGLLALLGLGGWLISRSPLFAPASRPSAAALPSLTPQPTTEPPRPTVAPLPTLTAQPTAEPPRLENTPPALPQAALSPANLSKAALLARWGKGRLMQAAFSPDGKTIAIASGLGVYLYDAATLRPLQTNIPESFTNAIAYQPGTNLLAMSVQGGAKIKVIDPLNLNTKAPSFPLPSDLALTLSYAPGGGLLAAGSQKGTVFLWDALNHGDAAEPRQFKQHTAQVNQLAFSPDGKTLASASQDGSVILWDTASGKPLLTLTSDGAPVTALAYAPGGRVLVTATRSTVYIWEVPGGSQVKTFKYPHEQVSSLAFSPDGEQFLLGLEDGTLRLFDPFLWNVTHLSASLESAVFLLAYSPDSRQFLAAGEDGSLSLWDAAAFASKASITGFSGQILPHNLAFAPDASQVAIASGNRIQVWQVASGRLQRTFTTALESISGLVFSPDGKTLFAGSENHLTAFDPSSGKILWRSMIEGVEDLALSRDGKTLAAVGLAGRVSLWDAASGNEVFRLTASADILRGVDLSPGDGLLAACGQDNQVRVWDLNTRALRHTFSVHTDWAIGVVFSPDGKRLVSVGGDQTARIWDIGAEKLLFTLALESGGLDADFSSDGRLLAVAAGGESPVQVWDPQNGTILRRFSEPHNFITAIQFSPECHLLAALSDDGAVYLYGLP